MHAWFDYTLAAGISLYIINENIPQRITMHSDPIIQLAISKGILKADSLSAIQSDKDPIDFLIKNGILQQQQVDELKKELMLAAQETAIANRRIQTGTWKNGCAQICAR
jgi:hypothetical protein